MNNFKKVLLRWIKENARFDLENPYQLTLIILAATVLLLQNLWVKGFFHDGHLYAALGKNALEKGRWLLPTLSDTYFVNYPYHPPLYPIISGLFFKIFGVSWMSARGYSCLWSLALVTLLFYFIKLHGDRQSRRPHCYEGAALFHNKSFSNKGWAYFSSLFLILFPPLIKKSRSPNIDVPLTFFILLGLFFYFSAYKLETLPTKKRREELLYWILAGVSFGLALWIKGPPALALPMTVIVHLLLTGRIKKILDWMPWSSFLIGAAIFALWPLLLWKNGLYVFFLDYLHTQVFATVIAGRGETDLRLFLYPLYFLENLTPWFLLSFWGIYLVIKERCRNSENNALGVLFFSLFASVIIAFSFVKWKYSNYIVPSFPALAVLSAYPIASLARKYHGYVTFFLKKILLLITLLILIFPITVKSNRDYEIIKLLDVLSYLQKGERNQTKWVIVDEIYPFNNLVNLLAWEGWGNVVELNTRHFSEKINEEATLPQEKNYSVVFLISRTSYLQIKKQSKKLKEIMYFPSKDMMVLMASDMVSSYLIDDGKKR